MANKLKPEIALDMTIEALAIHFGWSRRTVEYLTNYLPPQQNVEDIEPSARTLRELLLEVERQVSAYHGCPQAITLRLKEIGLTRLDTSLLSANTVTFDLLKEIPREKLLQCEAGVLGTLSDGELLDLRDRQKKDYDSSFTISDLLAMKRERVRGKGAARTLVLLERLGFTSKDGPFMWNAADPRRILANSLVNEDGLTKEEAERFANIAARRNWI